MSNPITSLTKKEWAVWIGALLIIVVSNIFSANFNVLTLVASGVGVTSLIIAAKGNVWSQILMILFSVLYGIISLLGRDDDVSWNDDADGNLVNDHMDPESVREWKRS